MFFFRSCQKVISSEKPSFFRPYSPSPLNQTPPPSCLLSSLFWFVDFIGMGLTAQPTLISKFSESPEHISLLGISGCTKIVLSEQGAE